MRIRPCSVSLPRRSSNFRDFDEIYYYCLQLFTENTVYAITTAFYYFPGEYDGAEEHGLGLTAVRRLADRAAEVRDLRVLLTAPTRSSGKPNSPTLARSGARLP